MQPVCGKKGLIELIILSVDYGDARTGIAICDKNEILATPVTVIAQAYTPKLIKSICDIVTERKPEIIVVGLPVNMDSSEGGRAAKCREFASELETACGVKTVMRDERLTTVSAYGYLNQTDTRGKQRKDVVDAVAATIILQDYIDYRRLNKNEGID